MIDLVRTELLKLATTRMVYWFLAGLLAIVALANIIGALVTPAVDLAGEDNQVAFFGAAESGIFFVVLLGVMVMAGEFRHGTITQTLLITPNRWKVLGAKLLTGAILGLVFGALAEGFSLLTAVPLLTLRGVDLELGDEALGLVVGTLLATMLSAMFGVGLATLIRNQVFAIILVFAVFLIVEPLVGGLIDLKWPEIPKYFPTAATTAVIDPGADVLSREGGVAVLLAYIGVLAGVGGRLVLSRDVNSIQA